MLFPHVMEVLMSKVMSSDDPYKLEEQSGDTQLDQHQFYFSYRNKSCFHIFHTQ